MASGRNLDVTENTCRVVKLPLCTRGDGEKVPVVLEHTHEEELHYQSPVVDWYQSSEKNNGVIYTAMVR